MYKFFYQFYKHTANVSFSTVLYNTRILRMYVIVTPKNKILFNVLLIFLSRH